MFVHRSNRSHLSGSNGEPWWLIIVIPAAMLGAVVGLALLLGKVQ